MSALDSLRNLSDREQITADEVFEAMFEAGRSLCDQERESEVALEIAIRLLEARRIGKIPRNCAEAVALLT